MSKENSNETPRFQRANTKSLTLETLLNAFYAADIEETEPHADYVDGISAERIRFDSNEVTATIWRPGLDVADPNTWQCPWDAEQGLRMRMFLRGNLASFQFNGLSTESIEIDMSDDGELRPIFDDPRGVQIGQPIAEADVMKLVTKGVQFVDPELDRRHSS